jgi:hypothetical protein
MQRVPSLKGVLIEYACSCTLWLTTRGVYTRTAHPRKPNSGKGMKVVVVGLDTLTYLGAASREEIDTRGAVQDPANLPITMTNKIIRVVFFCSLYCGVLFSLSHFLPDCPTRVGGAFDLAQSDRDQPDRGKTPHPKAPDQSRAVYAYATHKQNNFCVDNRNDTDLVMAWTRWHRSKNNKPDFLPPLCRCIR